MSVKTTSAFLLAAATLALSGVSIASDKPMGASGKTVGADDKVHCYNIHDCKGNSDCKTTEHACKGQNACKGHGFKATSAKACLDQKGVIGDL